jgi:hypothetical protein
METFASSTTGRHQRATEASARRRGCGCRSVVLDGHCLDCGAPA